VRVVSVTVRDFRSYERAAAPLGDGLTVVVGPNGAGKTNLLDAIYFGCTGRSSRTANDRELVRFGAHTTRVVVRTRGDDGPHELAVGFTHGEPKQMTVDGAAVERLLDTSARPLVSVFLPDRLELVKGVPALRRAHLDQFVAALWPARAENRRGYAHALAQRNALLARLRAGAGSRSSLDTWDLQLARSALALMADRREAIEITADDFRELATRLGLDGDPGISYRPRSDALDADTLVEELRARIDSDLERGFTGHGPHRDDFSLTRDRRELRTYGSQGQQRLGLLGLLLAERAVIDRHRATVPLMLLDDVMSELDKDRRAALVEVLTAGGGQSLITTTDLEHVPGADGLTVSRITVGEGTLAHESDAEVGPA
jgi:DNA replication and repair protein RecF